MASVSLMPSIASAAIGAATLAIVWRLYRRARPKHTAASVLAKYADALAGKRVLVTGACTGLGFELVRSILQECDVREVFVHGRSRERVELAIASLPAHRDRCRPVVADLSSLKAVDAMAEGLTSQPIDVIICCAGVATLPQKTLSCDGYETQFAINHLSHFLMVSRLLPHLPRAARIVMVTSDLHSVGKLSLDMNNLNSSRSYSLIGAYLASKYCNVLFARELARRASCDAGGGCGDVVACSATPGPVLTGIDRYLSAPLRFCFRYLGPGLVAQSPAEGAATIAWCAAAPQEEVCSGGYYSDCRLKALSSRGGDAQSQADQTGLWVESEALVKNALANARLVGSH